MSKPAAYVLSTKLSYADYVETFQKESNVKGYCRSMNTIFTKASGSMVKDVRGRQYIDFLAGASSLNYGHNDPDMAQALIEYIVSGGITMSLDLHTKAKAEFINAFNEIILNPRKLSYRLQFVGPVGNNAVEAALKLAKKITGRTDIISFTNGWHGVTLGAMAVTGNQHHRMSGAINLPGVTRAFYEGYFGPNIDTVDMLDQLLSDPSSGVDAPAAFLIETVQGEGGLNVVTSTWIQKLAKVAKRHGALLIIDDIQAGCGRTGTFFSFESLGIEPDMVLLAKSISGYGLPMALVLIKPEYDQWLPGEHNGTFRGNNLAFVTAKVTLEKFWSDTTLMEEVKRKGKIIKDVFSKMAEKIPDAKIKGRGMMLGLDVCDGALATAITKHCYANGLLIEGCGPEDEVLKVLAPLTTPDYILLKGLNIIENAINHVSKA